MTITLHQNNVKNELYSDSLTSSQSQLTSILLKTKLQK